MVQPYGEFTGRVESLYKVDIRSRVTGYIDKVTFTDGQEVKKDQVLFEIDKRTILADLAKAKSQLERSQAGVRFAQQDLSRMKTLAPQGAVSQQDLDQATAKFDEATATVATNEATIRGLEVDLSYTTITSPIDGKVSSANFTAGNLVSGDALLTTVVSVDPTYVVFDVDESSMLEYRATARAAGIAPTADLKKAGVPVLVSLANEKDFPHTGILDFADNQVNAKTGTIRARGIFENSRRDMTAGMFVRVRIPKGPQLSAMLIPDRAVLRDQDRRYVLVVDDKNVVQYRSVEIGEIQPGGLRVILSGLAAGEWVISDGVQRARPGSPVTPQKPGESTTQPANAAPVVNKH
jgi:RND family efflux transporter MFP subunit